VRRVLIQSRRLERERGVPVARENQRIIVAVTAASGGRFRPFDGVSERGKEQERRGGVGEDEGAMGRRFRSLQGEGVVGNRGRVRCQ
jgi:hypothetical protein